LDLHVPAVELSLPSEDRRAYWTEVQTTTGLPRFAPVREKGTHPMPLHFFVSPYFSVHQGSEK
jgi:hypothetical protein